MSTNALVRRRVAALDQCLVVLEEALLAGRTRVDQPLGIRLRQLLGTAGVLPDHRLEGRRIDRVLDDVFELQGGLLGVDADDPVAR